MKAKPKSYEVTVKQFELHVAETVMTVVGAKSRAQAVALGAAHVVGGNLPLPTGVKIVGAMETCTEFDDIEDRAWSPLELPHVKKAVLLAELKKAFKKSWRKPHMTAAGYVVVDSLRAVDVVENKEK